ncbi:hypothetical protein Glove_142g51 [Diversispora epigaea]|uniref:Uncharacterized protein n=1 Tax=Diversispora epigaea TaxID=1348612 RepID=A0A397IZ41_9GLOM|nr:hypothetical protein Glove_142g51 [Diversispora epigaea]
MGQIRDLSSVNKIRRRLSPDEKETNKEDNEIDKRDDEKIKEEEEIQMCLLATALIWNKPKKNKRIVKEIPKITYYYKFGTSSVLANTTKGTLKITVFLRNKKTLNKFTNWSAGCFSNGSELVKNSFVAPMLSESLKETDENLVLCERIEQLQDNLLKNEKTLSAFEYNK